MTQKHTPAPWVLRESTVDVYDGYMLIVGDFGIIAKIGGNREKSEIKANAEHIVKCVNMHDELVDALEDLVQEIKGSNKQKWYGTDIDLYEAEQALSKAKGN
jgi:hypothetical protein